MSVYVIFAVVSRLMVAPDVHVSDMNYEEDLLKREHVTIYVFNAGNAQTIPRCCVSSQVNRLEKRTVVLNYHLLTSNVAHVRRVRVCSQKLCRHDFFHSIYYARIEESARHCPPSILVGN